MELSIQRFFVFKVISFLLSPVAILSADRALLPEHVLGNHVFFALKCLSREKDLSHGGMYAQLSLQADLKQLSANEARQAVHLRAIDEEIATIERRQRQEKAAKDREVLRQRAALLATVDRTMSAGWSSESGNKSWR